MSDRTEVDVSHMSVADALTLAEQYRTTYAGSIRQPAFVRALLALAERERQVEASAASPDSRAGRATEALDALADVVNFAYEQGYHEHGVDLVGHIRAALRDAAAPVARASDPARTTEVEHG